VIDTRVLALDMAGKKTRISDVMVRMMNFENVEDCVPGGEDLEAW
jgi:hypothetical protein